MFSKLKDYLLSSEVYAEFGRQKNKNINIACNDGVPLAMLLSLMASSYKHEGRTWVICPTEEMTKALWTDLSAVKTDVLTLNSTGTVLYSPFLGSTREYEMLSTLDTLESASDSVILTNIRAFCSPVLSLNTQSDSLLKISVGDILNFTEVSDMLSRAGYSKTELTGMPGDFSMHGEVLDFFPFGKKMPVRIYLDWDCVSQICFYNPETQLASDSMTSVTVRLVSSEKDIRYVEKGIMSYVEQEKDLFVFYGMTSINSSYNSLLQEARSIYRNLRRENALRSNQNNQNSQNDQNSQNNQNSQNFPDDGSGVLREDLISPENLLLDIKTFSDSCVNRIFIHDFKSGQDDLPYKLFSLDTEGPRSYFGNITFLKEDLSGLLNEGCDVNIVSATDIQSERLSQILSDFKGIDFSVVKISAGFSLPLHHLVVMTDNEIFGRRKQIIKTLRYTKSDPLSSFTDLHEGDYVVHVNYGIGKYESIERLHDRDYIKILFADNEKLYVPIEQADLIQKYIGSSGEAPKCDRLGSGSWESKKARAAKSAEELAEHLISLYAKRQNSHGFAFEKDNEWQLRFEALFDFEETEDQLNCIQEIKADMESPVVMDRLICGDVGYGKTELAFRAAFKAVMSGKQVAFLAPTTILAEQHYRNFKNRVSSFPVKVGLLSRMVSSSETKKILSALKDGSLDVVFGTHRIIQKDVVLRNPGLLVVDEEQRFGVKDKERIKALKTNIDCLSLSATPIPRTLYMSLLKIRDMSLLTTAPIQRKPIKTVIERFNLDKVKQAILYELSRHGQVYYLHNRIETLEETADMLRSLVPSAIIETANGQMDPVVLEDVMRRFIYEGIQVLVSTTIIENGIDIPNVNTIIIDRSDLYGVAQLYQLRGRVGRSDKEAYAYLFYPSDYGISEQAIKRLRIIDENTELGSGFKVAMKDMEMRGAGNILGREQSGFMSSVGLDMYLKLLDEAVYKLKNNGEKPDDEVFLELDYSGFIPDTYVSDSVIKFEIYKKIAGIRTEDELESLKAQLKDRFGTPDDSVYNLLYICEIKIVCRKLNIYHIKEKNGVVSVEFSRVGSINMDHLINMIRTSNGMVSVNPSKMNVLNLRINDISLKDKALFILEKLQRLVV